MISTFELFKLGVGPSSSHTTGPMVAAGAFVDRLAGLGLLDRVAGIEADLYGSLALTGKGHATERAIVAGIGGERPPTTSAEVISALWSRAERDGLLAVAGRDIAFTPARDIRFLTRERRAEHSNAMRLVARDADGAVLEARCYFSIGGGFVRDEDEIAAGNQRDVAEAAFPYPFTSGVELLAMADAAGFTIAQLMRANERALADDAEIDARLDLVAATMASSIDAGCCTEGVLPGGLNVRRRAPAIAASLRERDAGVLSEPLAGLDWINLWAMAVNEENAAGGRVVTAPTNGAAGVIPAVIRYYERMCRGNRQGVRDFLLTASAIGALYKRNASISGAEVGCQGEVGVACSMAAAGLTAALGGTNAQIENAAEIGMEHNLGLTCDPIAGLVQIPCIERNAMGAVKAIDASRIAMIGDGSHIVSLDKVIATMWQTGQDMRAKYKETSTGGLAVNVVEC